MTSAYILGSSVTCSDSFTSNNSAYDPPVVLFAVSDPAGTITTHAYNDGSGVVIRDSIGHYHAVVTNALTGIYSFGFSVSSTPVYSSWFVSYDAGLANACIITDLLEGVATLAGEAGAPLHAYPVSDGTFLRSGANWPLLDFGSALITTNAQGQWSVALPWGSASDPATVQWAIRAPSGYTVAGIVPSVLGPVSLKTLKDSYGWGVISSPQAPVTVVQGPPGMNPRGLWSAIATYGVNDVVFLNGASYIALSVNTNSQPSNAGGVSTNANWALVALPGGSADATTGTVGGLLLRTAASGAHPVGLTTDDLGAASGVAGLDAAGRLVSGQFPVTGQLRELGNTLLDGMGVSASGLGLTVAAGHAQIGGARGTYAGGTLTATDNSTQFLDATLAGSTVSLALTTTDLPAGSALRLARIVTSHGASVTTSLAPQGIVLPTTAPGAANGLTNPSLTDAATSGQVPHFSDPFLSTAGWDSVTGTTTSGNIATLAAAGSLQSTTYLYSDLTLWVRFNNNAAVQFGQRFGVQPSGAHYGIEVDTGAHTLKLYSAPTLGGTRTYLASTAVTFAGSPDGWYWLKLGVSGPVATATLYPGTGTFTPAAGAIGSVVASNLTTLTGAIGIVNSGANPLQIGGPINGAGYQLLATPPAGWTPNDLGPFLTEQLAPSWLAWNANTLTIHCASSGGGYAQWVGPQTAVAPAGISTLSGTIAVTPNAWTTNGATGVLWMLGAGGVQQSVLLSASQAATATTVSLYGVPSSTRWAQPMLTTNVFGGTVTLTGPSLLPSPIALPVPWQAQDTASRTRAYLDAAFRLIAPSFQQSSDAGSYLKGLVAQGYGGTLPLAARLGPGQSGSAFQAQSESGIPLLDVAGDGTTTTAGGLIAPSAALAGALVAASGTISGDLTVNGLIHGTLASLAGVAYTGQANTFTAGPQILAVNPAALSSPTHYGLLSLGAGPFDGATAGFFAGSAAGTHLAVNALSTYVGNLLDLQFGGVSRLAANWYGDVTAGIMAAPASVPTISDNLNAGAVTTGWHVLGYSFVFPGNRETTVTISAPYNALNSDVLLMSALSSAPPGAIARNVYMSKSGATSGDPILSTLYFVKQTSQVNTATSTANLSDTALGANAVAPAVNWTAPQLAFGGTTLGGTAQGGLTINAEAAAAALLTLQRAGVTKLQIPASGMIPSANIPVDATLTTTGGVLSVVAGGGSTTSPTLAAGASAGGTPPAPVLVRGDDRSGYLTFGTGTTPAAGEQVVVTFGTALGSTPKAVLLTWGNGNLAGTLYTGAASITTAGFSIDCSNAPTASQANSHYAINYRVEV